MRAYGQVEADSTGMTRPTTTTISSRADSIFRAHKPVIDSTYLRKELQVKDNFWKRISIHTNLVDWVLTLPNLGLELDLEKGNRNRRSLLLFGKFNGNGKQSVGSKMIFNYMQVRGEFRKYWRTGNIGAKRTYSEYKRIYLHKPSNRRAMEFPETRIELPESGYSTSNNPGKKLSKEQEKMRVVEFPGVKAERIDSFYVTHEDSVAANGHFYNGDPNRGWWYNHYHKVRRRLSTRTVTQPRNWRAYYLGFYGMMSKHSLCIQGKGNQGSGLGIGAVAGWSIPILPNRYPHEGGLDLDLGVSLGLKIARNDKYRFDEEFRCFVPTNQGGAKFRFVKYPVCEDIHIALVYRFRSISHKVDLSIVDDYMAKVQRFEERRDKRISEMKDSIEHMQTRMTDIQSKMSVMNDSITFWDKYHRRRLANAILIDSTVVFHGLDSVLEAKFFPERIAARQQAEKEAKKVKKTEKPEKPEKEGKKAKKAKQAENPEQTDKEDQAPESTPDSPGTSETPEAPDTPDSPDTPEQAPENNPENPDNPDNSKIPAPPETDTPQEGGES